MNTQQVQNLQPGDTIISFGNEHTIAAIHAVDGMLELEYVDNPMLRDLKYPHSTMEIAS